jgi:23S rRNA pseudouridine2457 synthase
MLCRFSSDGEMTASVGFPTLRPVRVGIQNIRLGNLKPGEVKEISREEIYRLLFS